MLSSRWCNGLLIGFSLLANSNAFAPVAFTSNQKVSLTKHFSTAGGATALPEGLVKTVSKEGRGTPARRGDVATVKYSCYLPDYVTKIPFAKSDLQKVVVGDGTMVDGWEMAIKTMKEGERATIRIENPELGYGSEGIASLVPPDSPIEIDIEVLEVAAPLDNIDFDALGMADPIKPRTASRIQEAYEDRLAAKSLEPEKEGLEAWIEKAKNFYFFGFFEGETGEKAPWYLRPSITFPIAFVVVGAAFAVTLGGGGITERGAPSTDELDEIIVSSTAILSNPTTVLALALTAFSPDTPLL